MLQRWAPVVVALLVLLVYAPTLEAPFVWDDRHLVLESEAVTEPQRLDRYFTQAFWTNVEGGDSRIYYRPLVVLSMALDYRLHGPNPGGFHLTNLVFHCLNTLLLFGLMRQHRVRSGAAAVLALLWALHPRLTEATAWVSGRTDVLATTGVLLALLVYRPRSLLRGVLASALVFLALLAKEVALAGMLALVLLEVSHTPRGFQSDQRRSSRAWYHFAPLVMMGVLYLLLRSHALEGVERDVETFTWGHRALVVLAALGHYAQMLVLPWLPSIQIGEPKNPDLAFVLLGVGGVVAGALAGLNWGRRWRHYVGKMSVAPSSIMGACLVTVGLGLVLHVIPFSVGVIAADRFLYLPAAGGCLLAARCVQRGLNVYGQRAWIAAGLLIASFTVAASVRVGDWSSELRLWAKAYRSTPKTNPIPGNELGNLYYRAGLYSKAAAVFSATAQASPEGIGALANLANAQSQMGHYTEARAILARLCEQHPTVPKFCMDAALVELGLLNFEAATRRATQALDRAPSYRAASEVQQLVRRVRVLVQAPEYDSADPETRARARFRVAVLAGQRMEALALGEALLRSPATPRAMKREAAEYWARFGPPQLLSRLLGDDTWGPEVVDDGVRAAVAVRTQTADELLEHWPSLGITAD